MYYNFDNDYTSIDANTGGILAGFGFLYVIILIVSLISIVSMWKLFKKAGKKGWESLIPIYSNIVLIQIAGLPVWYFFLLLVPIANIYALFKIYIELAHKFGKSTGFGVAMVFFNIICVPILAFGKAQYESNSNICGVENNNNQSSVHPNSIQQNNIGTSITDVNSEGNFQTIFDINAQNVNSSFQPIGNVNNNIQNIDTYNNSIGSNNVNPNMNNMMTNNFDIPVNTSTQVSDNVSTFSGEQGATVNNFDHFGNSQSIDSINVNQVNNDVNNINSSNNISSDLLANSVNNYNQVSEINNNVHDDVNQDNDFINQKKFCPNCGSQMEFNAVVCSNCGRNL